MKLRELLANIANVSFSSSHPALDEEVKGVTTNSQACQTGYLFIGMPGTRVDGGDFWPSAIAPERKGDAARLGIQAMIAGSFACFMTACIAGILL
ncbi:MAG: nucleoside transporter C-terminal domain-containing protein [Microcoleaceae cyanobacterium]